MEIQTILVALLFVAALVYIGRMIYRSLAPSSGGCASNCKCGIDFSDIETNKK